MEKEEDILIEIGEKLRYLREKAGKTNYELFAYENGLNRSGYGDIENGKVNITIRTLLKLLAIHDISLKEFISNTPRKSSKYSGKGRKK